MSRRGPTRGYRRPATCDEIMMPIACGNVVRPLCSGSSPRRPCRYSGITNVRPMKLAIAKAITTLVARNSRSLSRRRASIGCGWWVSTYTSSGERQRADDPQRDHPRIGPADERSLVDGVGDRRQADAREHEAGDVEAPGRGLGVLAQVDPPEGEGDGAERDVDVEDPAPADGVGDEAAEHGPEGRGDERRDHHDRRRPGPLDRREGPEQHGDPDRREHPAADALEDPEGDQLADRLRRAARHRAGDEQQRAR